MVCGIAPTTQKNCLTIPGGWGWGVVIISYKAISVQSIEIEFGLTGTELGKKPIKMSFSLFLA